MSTPTSGPLVLNRVLFRQLLSNKSFRRALYVVAGAGGIALFRKLRSPGNDGKKADARPRPPGYRPLTKVDVYRLLRIMIPSYSSREFGYIVILALLLVMRTIFSGIVAEIAGSMIQSFVAREWSKGGGIVINFAAFSIPAALVNSGLKYFTTVLSLQFRVRLSKYVHDLYLNDVTFYNVCNLGVDKLDDVDQRITSDIQHLSYEASDLFTSTFKPVLDVFLFTALFGKNVGWPGPAILYSYFAFSAFVKRVVMPSFGKLSARESELEGQYRSAHQRLITNNEEIAFYDGSRRERVIVNSKLDEIRVHVRSVAWLRGVVNILDQLLVKYWASMAGYLSMFLPVILNFAASQNKSTLDLTRDYATNGRYLANVADAVGQLVLLGNRISSLKGYMGRVITLFDRMEGIGQVTSFAIKPQEPTVAHVPVHNTFLDEWKLRRDKIDAKYAESYLKEPVLDVNHVKIITGDTIRFEHVNIISPEGKLLVEDLGFEVKKGQNVMVTGPNGSGKSSLFRVIGDLWPPSAFTGTASEPLTSIIVKPPKNRILFVPQKPYLVLGSLRDQIIYPHSREDMIANGVTDDDLSKLLQVVDPENKILRTWRFDEVRDWFSLFSGGQKQRVAMARVFYHRPQFAILDECTSAVSDDVEDIIYETCRELGITLFTVSHRKSLRRHHDHELRFEGRNGIYRFKALDKKKQAALDASTGNNNAEEPHAQ